MAYARQWARNGNSTTSRRRIDTPRNAPSDAAAERALLFTPAVPRRSLGPHAWSRARVDRLAPRKKPRPSGEGSPFTLHCAPASPFLTPKSWYVGVRGILWPYAGFRPFKFRWGRARAPSTHATETPDPRWPSPQLWKGSPANAVDVPAKRTRASTVHQIAAITSARQLRVPAAALDASVTSLAGTTVSGARGAYRSP